VARCFSVSIETLSVSLVRMPGSCVAAAKAPRQKDCRADQEERRCADLDGDQYLPRASRTRILRHFAAHGPHHVETGGLQRRCEPEEHRRYGGAN
jgi:hypothetical protein